MIIHCKYDIVFVQFFNMFYLCFFNNKACNWSIGFLQIVNISKLYHMLGSNYSTFYVWSFQVSFPYKFLVLKTRILLLRNTCGKRLLSIAFQVRDIGEESLPHGLLNVVSDIVHSMHHFNFAIRIMNRYVNP
jgi:hypothetical protein